MLLLYRDARSTDSDFNHVKVILDTVTLDWNTMHNTYGVPANASGDTTVTFISYDSGTTGYRRCYFDSNHNVHSSYMPSNTVYFDESDGTFYIFPTGTTRKRTNPYVPFLNSDNEQIELHEFTYAAKRMDKAPTLTATFYDYECYDKKWNTNNNDQKKVQRYYNIFTILNGERYYLKNTPTSVFEDKDARYKHSLVFLSERDILEHTIMFDSVHTTYPIFDTNTSYAQNAIVQYGALYYQFLVAHSAGPWDITQVTQLTGVTSPVSESAEFSFYGTAIDLANRINGVLVQSGITTYDQTSDTYDGYHVVFDYYQPFSTTTNYSVDDIVIYNNKYYIFTQKHNAGAWNSNHVKEYTLPGLAISFDKETIYDALQKFNTDFELMYYFDGQTIYVKEYQNLVSATIEQGVEDALLSIEKQNKNSELVSRMTAIGSEDNIPYYYPNPTEDGFLKPIYQRDGSTITTVTAQKNDNYENSFYKNRSKYVFKNCRVKDVSAYVANDVIVNKLSDAGAGVTILVYFKFSVTENMIDNGVSYIPIMYNNEDPFLSYVAYPMYVRTAPNSSGTIIHTFSTDSDAVNKLINQDIILFPCSNTGTYYLEVQLRYQTGNPPSAVQWNGNLVTVVSGYYYAPVILNDNDVVLDYFYSRGDLQYINSQYAYLNDNGEWVSVSPLACLYVDPDNTSRNVIYRDLSTNKYYRYDPYQTIAGVRPTYARFVEITASQSELNSIQYRDTYLVGKTSHRSYEKGWRLFNGGQTKDVGDISNLNRIDDYGIIITGTVRFFDEIHFLVEKYLQPQPHLMPELYQKTDGARRFYDATQYPIRDNVQQHQLDTDSGEYLTSDGANPIVSNHYYEDSGGNYMVIENPYEQGNKREYISEYDDIKPTLKDAKIKIGSDGNYSPSGTLRPIDVFLEFAYDLYDSDEMIEATGNESDQLAYRHPYFFAKLRPLGFNLFDMAIDESEMVVNFTTGHCGSCEFKVMVGEKYKQNTVRIWKYDVFYYNESGNLEYAYQTGDLMRYDNRDLYREASGGTYELITDEGLKDITTGTTQSLNGLIVTLNSNAQRTYRTWGDVICTDVTLSSVEETQKDTTNTPTWICLMKDISTFNTIMPSTMRILAPASVASAGGDAGADKFVFTHIKMPQTYVRNAEVEVTKQLIKDLVLMNAEQWAFAIKFSRIYYAENAAVATLINENTLFNNVVYDGVVYELAVESFTYKVQNKDALPEITVQVEDLKNKIRYRKRLGGVVNPFDPFDPWIVVREDDPDNPIIRIRRASNRLNIVSSSVADINDIVQILSLNKADKDIVQSLDYFTDQTKRQAIDLEINQGFLEFDPTATYQVGDIVKHNRILYKFTANKSAGDWDSTKVSQTTIGSEDGINKGNIKILDTNQGYPEFDVSTVYEKGSVVRKDGFLYRFTAKHNAGTSWASSSKTQTNIGSEDGISRDAANAADLKASNILTDLGFQLFDSTRSYSENEIVVYNNRLYRFTTSKSVGGWDVSKVALDSVANCVFRSLGLEEYNSSSTQTIRRGTSFFKNGKAFIATQDFVPSQVGVDVTRVTNPYNVVAMTATDSDTKALSQTVETLRQTVSSLNSQILDKDNGLATIVRGVNSRLATLTDDMATLADAIKDNEYLAQDVNVTNAAAAVSNSANAATTELTGADDSSTYNKMADVYSKDIFGERIAVVRAQFSTEDASFKFTKMVYDTSHYMTTQDATFVEFSTEVSYEVKDRVIYNKHLYEFTSSHKAGSWNPSDVTNVDDILLKAVFFATDRYSETPDNIFLTKGRFIDTNAFCDYVYETVIKSGEAGILYTDLKDIVEAASKDYEDIYDGGDKNMITDHVWAVGGYTVLQFASLRLEYNDRIYVAATYKEDYTRNDEKHILFDIRYINTMSEKLQKFFIESDKEVEYDGQMYYYMPRVELAKNLGDNYLYCADAQVDDNKMLFVAELYVECEPIENCYLLPKE